MKWKRRWSKFNGFVGIGICFGLLLVLGATCLAGIMRKKREVGFTSRVPVCVAIDVNGSAISLRRGPGCMLKMQALNATTVYGAVIGHPTWPEGLC